MSTALIAHLQDLCADLGHLTARAMFGGYGIYLDGLLIGVLIEDALYLKADEQTTALFGKAGGAPYVYLGQQRPITMSYWSLPEEALESSEAAAAVAAAGAGGGVAQTGEESRDEVAQAGQVTSFQAKLESMKSRRPDNVIPAFAGMPF